MPNEKNMTRPAQVSRVSPQRGAVALLNVDERTEEKLRESLNGGYQIEIFESHEPLLSALGLGSLKIDTLLIGVDAENALDIAITVRQVLKYLQIIVLAEIRDVEALRSRAEIQSDNTDEVTIWPCQHLEELPDVVRKAIKRSHRRVRRDEEGSSGDDGNGGNGAVSDATSHLTRLLEHAPIGILTISDSGEVKTLNKQARLILDVEAGHLINRPLYDFFPVFEQNRLRRLLRSEPREKDEEKNDVFRIETEPTRYIEVIAAGDVTQKDLHGTMLILHDVTNIVLAQQAERRTAAALQASEDRFNELADVMRMIPWEADPKTMRLTYIGSLVEETMGYPPSQWLSRNFWRDRLHPEDRDRVLRTLDRNIMRLQNFDLEFRMFTRDGRIKWVRNIVNVVRDDHGTPTKIRGFIVDIDESKATAANA